MATTAEAPELSGAHRRRIQAKLTRIERRVVALRDEPHSPSAERELRPLEKRLLALMEEVGGAG